MNARQQVHSGSGHIGALNHGPAGAGRTSPPPGVICPFGGPWSPYGTSELVKAYAGTPSGTFSSTGFNAYGGNSAQSGQIPSSRIDVDGQQFASSEKPFLRRGGAGVRPGRAGANGCPELHQTSLGHLGRKDDYQSIGPGSWMLPE